MVLLQKRVYGGGTSSSIVLPMSSTTTTTLTQQQDEDEDEDEDEETTTTERHVVPSLGSSTVEIRQLTSRGLSFQLWPAAKTLVGLLGTDPTAGPLGPTLSARTRILELGSGTGLVGISFAAALGAHVTVTDLPHVVPNLRFNAEANTHLVASRGGEVHVATLSWGVKEEMESIGRNYDLIIGSDLVYHDHLYDPLLQTLRFFLLGQENKKIVFIMGHLKRWKKESTFFKKAKKVFDVEVIHRDEAPFDDGARVGVLVYRFLAKVI